MIYGRANSTLLNTLIQHTPVASYATGAEEGKYLQTLHPKNLHKMVHNMTDD